MTLEDIYLLPVDQQVLRLKSQAPELPPYELLKAQWNPKDHDVFDTAKRPDKATKKKVIDETGAEAEVRAMEPVTRIGIPFQRIIVQRAVGFLLGNPVKAKRYIEDNDKQQVTLADMIDITLDDNKAKYFDRKLARTVKSQCQAAELWYVVEDPKFWQKRKSVTGTIPKYKIRCTLLSPSTGDKLFPYFDETGDMVAFSREYILKDGEKNVTHLDTWTADHVIKRAQVDGVWTEERTPNQLRKIPVIYYSQPEPDWGTVQTMIDRYEKKISNFGDTNDYFGSPMVKVKGTIKSLPEKTTSGKVIQMDADSDASYMSWDQSPESEKLEFELLYKMIHAMTQTPTISFAEMQAIGGEMSGFAIKLLFADAHMKAENDIELFGEMYQRRLNLLKFILGSVLKPDLDAAVDTLQVEPEFTPYLPKNVKETVDILAVARGNKALISRETALENNPLVGDIETELQRMQADADAEAEQMQKELTGSYE